MPGKAVTAAGVQNDAGTIANNMRIVHEQAAALGAYLAGKTAAELEALPGGMSAADANDIKSAFTAELVPMTADFDTFVFTKRLWGTGTSGALQNL